MLTSPRSTATLACLTLACLTLTMGSASAADTRVAASTSPAMDGREIRAQLMPKRYTTLAAEVGAKIQRLPIPEGGAFKAGQALVQFDCALPQAQLRKARAAQSAADATLKATTRLAELNSAGAVELEVARNEAAKAQADVSLGTLLVDKCQIVAPFAGRVAEQKVREQQYVQPGQPLLDILDDSTLELEFIAPSSWLAFLKVNSPFEIRIDETGTSYPAVVLRSAARVDPVSQSVKFTGAIKGRFPGLVAGMSGRVVVAAPQGR